MTDYIVCEGNQTAFEVADLFDLPLNPDYEFRDRKNYAWANQISLKISETIKSKQELKRVDRDIDIDESVAVITLKLMDLFDGHYVQEMSYDKFDPEHFEVLGNAYELVVFKPVENQEEPQKDQWDEKLRGKKMSSNSGKVIYKYQMPIKEHFEMRLPINAEIIRMDSQDGFFWLWAVVNTEYPDEIRKFHAVKCGGNMPDVEESNLVYRGCCAMFIQQELMLYIFEEIQK